ncbi:MAG: prepilin peptidase [Maricaulaceae bacterium]
MSTALALSLPGLMAWAAWRDLVAMTIPNWISVAIFAAFFPTALWFGLPPADIGGHALAAVCVLILGFGLFAAGWTGGGDAKILASSAVWFGFPHLMAFLSYVALCGVVLALAVLAARRLAIWWPGFNAADAPGWMRPKGRTPYVVAIVAAAFIVFPEVQASWLSAAEGH